jgi:hypothetical protein
MKGKTLRVLGHLRRNGSYLLNLELPDGTGSLIPATWTDFTCDDATSQPPLLAGSISHLLHARKVVDALLHKQLQQQNAALSSTGLLAHDTRNGNESASPAATVGEFQQQGATRDDQSTVEPDCQNGQPAANKQNNKPKRKQP